MARRLLRNELVAYILIAVGGLALFRRALKGSYTVGVNGTPQTMLRWRARSSVAWV